MAETNYLTQESFDKLKKDLHRLKVHERQDIAKQIQEAREKGDLSENAEYDAAKEAQAMLEHKIAKLETTIANAKVLDESKLDTSKVRTLCKVKLKNIKTGKTLTYKLVSETEADVKAKKISVRSPIGKGLLGKKVGDVVTIKVPNGEIKFEILDISI